MSHGGISDPSALTESDLAIEVAEMMQALATPSRLRILGRLHQGPCTVNALAAEIEMEASAVSHQLRLLRLLGLVVGTREGRTIRYALHDEHVGALLAEALSHREHRRLGRIEEAAPLSASAIA